MQFKYSNRILRFVFDVVTVAILMTPYLVIGEKYVSNNALFWGLNFLMLFTVFKITAILVKTFPLFTKTGSCYIKNGILVLQLGKKTYQCSTNFGVEELIYMQANRYKSILGTDWDKLGIRIQKKQIVLLAKPNEEAINMHEKELYKVFLMIKDACCLVEDTDTYAGNFIECYKPRQH